MSLSPGTHLGSFEITGLLGKGGMGEVYRAKDTKLGREVAIKVLPDVFAHDSERLGRFQREARLLASLNHPNIATIHDYAHDEASGVHYLVMEVIEGDTLGDRIDRGAIPVEDALPMFAQIAEALETAHEQGIIHRDLKPGNIKVSDDGKVKVLDFGLGKVMEVRSEPVSGDAPTRAKAPDSTKMSQEGVVLGTPVYMSPEQARGKPVDKRTDIWAFGCCLYEALTGRLPFQGETVSDTLAKVLERDPDWEALPKDTPWRVRELLESCLEKDIRFRLRDIGDAWSTLRRIITDSGRIASTATDARLVRRRLPHAAIGYSIAAVAVAAAFVLGMRPQGPSTPAHDSSPEVRRYLIDATAGFSESMLESMFTGFGASRMLALSPDGARLVYRQYDGEIDRLYIREMNRFESRPLQGSEGAYNPFFSPDGESLGFFDFINSQIKRVSLRGGGPTVLCDAPPDSGGASWGEKGQIVFSRGFSGGLYTVSAEGGVPQLLAEPDLNKREKSYRFPHLLPGEKAVLFTISTADIDNYDDASIAVISLATGEQTTLIEGGSDARYSPTGHIVYGRAGALMAAPFDVEALVLTGPPSLVLDQVITHDATGRAQFDFSLDGTLVYAPGGPESFYSKLMYLNMEGVTSLLPIEMGQITDAAFSPDGQYLLVEVTRGNDTLMMYNISRGSLSRLSTMGWDNNGAVWKSDSSEVIYRFNASGKMSLYSVMADGSVAPELLLERTAEEFVYPECWSSDGSVLIYTELGQASLSDIWSLPVGVDAEPTLVSGSRFDEISPRLSPDDRWLAYVSDETGRYEVYVQAFPNAAGKRQVSVGGGHTPRWKPDGNGLFYVNGTKLMTVSVETASKLSLGLPTEVLEFPKDTIINIPMAIDLAPDGQRFVVIVRSEAAEPITHLRVVVNWFEELKRLASVEGN